MNAEQLEALRAEMQFVNDAALSFHKGEEGKARALNVIATRSSVAIGLLEQLQTLQGADREWAAENEALAIDLNAEHVKVFELQEQLEALETAARQLYELVEMDESVGICLSSRAETLALRDVLSNPASRQDG